MILLIAIPLAVFVAIALYQLNRQIDAHFALRKALWDAEVELTLAIIEGQHDANR